MMQADATDAAVGMILLQRNAKGELQPYTYTSCRLSETEKRWTIWEKDAYVVQWALLTWSQFLEGSNIPFEVRTNHNNL